MNASRTLAARAARRALGAVVVLCLHAPLIADDAARTHVAAAVELPEPGEISPLRTH